MSNLNNEEIEQVELQEQEEFSAPAKVEKITLDEISDEKEKQEEEKTDELVNRILDKLLEIE
jgi:hypothetical protein